jgi:hypothetical protein
MKKKNEVLSCCQETGVKKMFYLGMDWLGKGCLEAIKYFAAGGLEPSRV